MSGQYINSTIDFETKFVDLESSERQRHLHEYGQDLFDLFESRVVNAESPTCFGMDHDARTSERSDNNSNPSSRGASPTCFGMHHDTRTFDSYVTEGSKAQTKPNIPKKTSTSRQALLRARIDHPLMLWKQIAKLQEVDYSDIEGAKNSFDKIKAAYERDASTIDQYVQEGYLTKAEIEAFLNDTSAKKALSLKRRKALLRTRIDHPLMLWKHFANLEEVDYSEIHAKDCFNTIKSEYNSDPSSIDKYVQEGYLTKAEIEVFFKNPDARKLKQINRQRALLIAVRDNPKKTWRNISDLIEVQYCHDRAKRTFEYIKKTYRSNPSSIDKYVQEGCLTQAEIEALFKKQLPSRSDYIKRRQALLCAKRDYPKKTWQELAKLEDGYMNAGSANALFYLMKSQYKSNPSSIDKYVKKGYLTKAEIEALFKPQISKTKRFDQLP